MKTNTFKKNTLAKIIALSLAGSIMAGCSSTNDKDYELVDGENDAQLENVAATDDDIIAVETDTYADRQAMEDVPSVSADLKEQTVHFAFDSSMLDRKAKMTLDTLADKVRQNPEGKLVVQVAGHTDEVGTEAYNYELSERRANAVISYLRSVGVDARTWDVDAYGENRPVATNATPAGRQDNRRAHIEIFVAEDELSMQ